MRRDTEYRHRWRSPSTAVRYTDKSSIKIVAEKCKTKPQRRGRVRTRANLAHSRPCHRVSHPLGASDRSQQANGTEPIRQRAKILATARCRDTIAALTLAPPLTAGDRQLPGRLLPRGLPSEAGRLNAQLSQTMAPDNALPPSRTNQSNGSNPRSRLSCQTWGRLKRPL
jgi:hypothetical protein